MKKKIRKIVCLAGLALAMSGMAAGACFAGAWARDGVGWWYDNGNGTYPASSWQWIDGSWYCFDSRGYMRTGWIDNTYYCAESGAMVTGWRQIGSSWYFFAGDGSMVRNQWVGEYYLLSSGKMATDRWIDGYWVDSDGRWDPDYDYDEDEEDDDDSYSGSSSASSSNYRPGSNYSGSSSSGSSSSGSGSSGSSNSGSSNSGGSSGSSSAADNQASNTNSTAAASQQKKDGWENEGGEWYYYENDQLVRNRLVKSGIYKYYVGSDGRIVKNTTITVDGVEYQTDSNGVAVEKKDESALSIEGHTRVVDYTIGTGFSLDGVISSNYTIERITVTIKKNRSVAYENMFNPNAKKYDLGNLSINSADVKDRGRGTWELSVTAEDASGTIKQLVQDKFSAAYPEGTKFTLSGETKPRTVSYGCNFGLYGVIECNYVIDEVDGRICKSNDGTGVVMRKEVYPNSKTYDLHGPINDALIFERLEKGNYYYIVTAKANGMEKTVIRQSFKVK